MIAAADYDCLARINRPTDLAVLALEIRRLRHSGLTARDIAACLRLDIGRVLEALVDPTSPPPPAAATSSSLGHSATDGAGRSSLNLTKGAFP